MNQVVIDNNKKMFRTAYLVNLVYIRDLNASVIIAFYYLLQCIRISTRVLSLDFKFF